jgi:hypothetical protein
MKDPLSVIIELEKGLNIIIKDFFFIIKFGIALMILKVRNTFVSRGISKPKYLVMNQGCTKSDKLFDFVHQ